MNRFNQNQASSPRSLWNNIIVHNLALAAQPSYLILYLTSKQHELSKGDFSVVLEDSLSCNFQEYKDYGIAYQK